MACRSNRLIEWSKVRLDKIDDGFLVEIFQIVLAKDCIILEPLEDRHFDGILASIRDPSIWKYMSFADLSDERAVRTWFNAALKSPLEELVRRLQSLTGIPALYSEARDYMRSIYVTGAAN